MIVVTIDPATVSGVCIHDTVARTTTTHTVPHPTLASMQALLPTRIDQCVIERPYVDTSRANAVQVVSEYAGTWAAVARDRGARVVMVPPSRWRQPLGIARMRREQAKQAIVAWARRTTGRDMTDHEADALGLLHWWCLSTGAAFAP